MYNRVPLNLKYNKILIVIPCPVKNNENADPPGNPAAIFSFLNLEYWVISHIVTVRLFLNRCKL